MKHRRLLAVGALLALMVMFVIGPRAARSGSRRVEHVFLFNGSNTSAAVDTAEQPSPWFYVRGASRVIIRVWSANTSAWTSTDSIYSDSLTTWKVLLSDSICCTVTDTRGKTIGSAADSLMIDMSTALSNPDTASVGIGAFPLPINKPLASAKSGSGRTVTIYPVGAAPFSASFTSVTPPLGVFGKGWMRIRTQASRRNTEGGRLSTSGKRTVGINGLRMIADVYYDND